jgi:spore germination protein KC
MECSLYLQWLQKRKKYYSPAKKNFYLFFLLLFVSVMLTGCWDQKELEERAFVTIVGIDKGTSEAGPNAVRVTYSIAKPILVDQLPTANKSSENITIEAATIFLTRDLANVMVSRKLSFLHTKFLVVSEEYAKRGKMITTIGSFIRDREFRRDIVLITCRGKAEDFIKNNKAQLEKHLYKQYELISQTGKLTGLIPYTQLQDFLVKIQNGEGLGTTALASLRRTRDYQESPDTNNTIAGNFATHTKNPIEYLGAAVYRNQKMIGKLTGEENRIMMTIQGKDLTSFQDWFAIPEMKNKVFVGTFSQIKPSVNIDMKRKPYHIAVTVRSDMDMSGIQAQEERTLTPQGIISLQNKINRKYEDQTKKLIKKSQMKYKGDLFEFYKKAKMQCWTDQEWKNKEWIKNYPHAKIDVKYITSIRRAGRQ